MFFSVKHSMVSFMFDYLEQFPSTSSRLNFVMQILNQQDVFEKLSDGEKVTVMWIDKGTKQCVIKNVCSSMEL